MDENNESPQEAPTAAQPVTEAPAATVPKTKLRDRVWSFRAMLAVGVATLLIGGAGGAAIVAATDNGHGHGRPHFGRFAGGPDGRGPGGYGGGFGRNGGPGFPGGPGQQFRNGPQNGPQNGQGGQNNTPPNAPQTQPTPTPKSGSPS